MKQSLVSGLCVLMVLAIASVAMAGLRSAEHHSYDATTGFCNPPDCEKWIYDEKSGASHKVPVSESFHLVWDGTKLRVSHRCVLTPPLMYLQVRYEITDRSLNIYEIDTNPTKEKGTCRRDLEYSLDIPSGNYDFTISLLLRGREFAPPSIKGYQLFRADTPWENKAK